MRDFYPNLVRIFYRFYSKLGYSVIENLGFVNSKQKLN